MDLIDFYPYQSYKLPQVWKYLHSFISGCNSALGKKRKGYTKKLLYIPLFRHGFVDSLYWCGFLGSFVLVRNSGLDFWFGIFGSDI